MRKYLPQEFEQNRARQWQESDLHAIPTTDEIRDQGRETFYSLYSFPYPSGAGLHVGHVEGMVANDIVARFERMNGKAAVLPMGWDSFGLPAENYAIKTGIHPQDSTDAVIETFREQINRIGLSVDWKTEVGAHWPSYYRWTQWIFLQLLKHDLAYQKEAPVNWCPTCQTTLANEQVIDGLCERCDTPVERRTMKQWFFRITAFAEELYHDLDQVDWPESTIEQQRNWIGRREGAEIEFPLEVSGLVDAQSVTVKESSDRVVTRSHSPSSVAADTDGEDAGNADKKHTLTVFTTRPDTIYGATFMVIAPEHPLVKLLTTDDQRSAVEAYVHEAAAKTDIQRTSTDREKTGVFTGSYAINPLTNDKIPVWIADYVLASYGTGAIMAVPGHDERDAAFATTYDLPITVVVEPADDQEAQRDSAGESTSKTKTETKAAGEHNTTEADTFVAFTKPGVAINSPLIDGQPTEQAKQTIIAHLEENGLGRRTITYKIRDWLVSRQRYWGAPIPVVYDPDGVPHPVAEDDLPVKLPYDVDFKPTGQSPLTYTKEFHQSAEQKFGPGWRREVDTMDTFVDSSWYFFRHLDAANENEVFDTQTANTWLPTDLYMIGPEHIVLHLLYARFFTKFFHQIGLIEFREPFARMRHMGTILGPDGRKMSKRWGNVINPTDVIDEYGADTVRVYEMFMGPLDQAKPWNPSNVQGSYRFLHRVWKLFHQGSETISPDRATADEVVTTSLQKTIQKVTADIPEMKFNTAIAAMMTFLNDWEKKEDGRPRRLSSDDARSFLQILAPFAPFLTDEIWQTVMGEESSIHTTDWPDVDQEAIVEDTIMLPVQINGKMRGTIEVAPTVSQDEAMAAAHEVPQLAKYLTDTPSKVIFVPGKILNVVV